MSMRKELGEIQEKKGLLVSKANLQRSVFLMMAGPVFKVVRAAAIGVLAVKTGRAFVRYIKHEPK